jgi:hypothetical protein
LVAGKVFTHNCDTGKFSALIQCNIVQQIERDGFQRLPSVSPFIYDVKISGFTRISIYSMSTTLAFRNLASFIEDGHTATLNTLYFYIFFNNYTF